MVLPTENTSSCSRFATALSYGPPASLERLEGVGRERVRPEVAVVAGRVAVAREDVR